MLTFSLISYVREAGVAGSILPLRPFLLAIFSCKFVLIAGGAQVNIPPARRTAFPRHQSVRAMRSLWPLKSKGAGNAGCTPHPLPCVQNGKDARRPTQVRRNHSGTPCAMVLRLLRALPGVSGLLASVACRLVIGGLDPSVEGTGPHGLTVHALAARLAAGPCPSHSGPRP